jgi:L,D-peptidoglycan transpeptidase YkuD (ErfK/YbiS/YcfS/YnhG family)
MVNFAFGKPGRRPDKLRRKSVLQGFRPKTGINMPQRRGYGQLDGGPSLLRHLVVSQIASVDRLMPPRGRMHVGGRALTCAIGGAGIRHSKREGDRATPAGRFACLGGFFKPRATRRLHTLLPLHPIAPELGWCDDPQAANYNRPVQLPSRFSHENMWRDDGLYDLVFVLDYNFSRRAKYRGSAIFLHCARPDFAPTQGCIALAKADWRRLLPRLSRELVVIAR